MTLCAPTQSRFTQAPSDVEFYELDFASRYLAGTGDTAGNLLALDFSANADGFTAIAQTAIGSPVPAGVLRVRCTGGVDGGEYKVTARIATAQARQKTWAITVLVRAL